MAAVPEGEAEALHSRLKNNARNHVTRAPGKSWKMEGRKMEAPLHLPVLSHYARKRVD